MDIKIGKRLIYEGQLYELSSSETVKENRYIKAKKIDSIDQNTYLIRVDRARVGIEEYEMRIQAEQEEIERIRDLDPLLYKLEESIRLMQLNNTNKLILDLNESELNLVKTWITLGVKHKELVDGR